MAASPKKHTAAPATQGHAHKKRTHVDMDSDDDDDGFAPGVGGHSTPHGAGKRAKKARTPSAALQAQRRQLPIYAGAWDVLTDPLPCLP
jgi:hypothetical protein